MKETKANKKRFWILLLFLLISPAFFLSFLEGSEKQGTLEFLIGNYGMSDPQFKAVYEKAGLLRGIGLTSHLAYDVHFSLEIKYLYRIGKLTYTKEETKFLLIPVSLGIRYVRPMDWALPYLGMGLDFCFYGENNAIGTVIDYAKGFHIQGGSYFRFAKNIPFWLNVRLKYTKAKTEDNNRKINLGGFEYGIGLVLAF